MIRPLPAVVVSALVVAVAAGCVTPEPADRTDCPPTPAPATGSVDGWLGILAAHRDSVSLQLHADPKVDARVAHREGEAQQSASTIKVVHLAAYAQAVAEGRLRPEQQVSLADWEKYYFPADGGAHGKALERLGIAATRTGAASVAVDQRAGVRLDDVVSAMIRESDDAAADLVRELVGPPALEAVLRDAGATATEPTSILGMLLAATHPEFASQPADELARRYTTDEAFARSVLSTPSADWATQQRYLADHPPRVSAADLDRLYRRIADGSATGADVARRHLEWQPPSRSGARIGFKGGSVPGMIGLGFERTAPDGTLATGALLVSGLDEATWTAAQSDPSWQTLVLQAVDDPHTYSLLHCALS